VADTGEKPQSDEQTKNVGVEADQRKVEAHVGQRQVAVPLPSLGIPAGVTGTRVLWFGALGGAAVAGVLSWPVAAAVGIGTVVSERLARQGVQGQSRREPRTIDVRESEQKPEGEQGAERRQPARSSGGSRA
jgi:hypothetical protein